MRQLCGLALLLAPCAWGETRVERNNPVPIFPYCGWSILIRKTADFLPDEPEAVCIAGVFVGLNRVPELPRAFLHIIHGSSGRTRHHLGTPRRGTHL